MSKSTDRLEGEELPKIFKERIIPPLTEYFFDDWTKVRAVLADDQETERDFQFITESESTIDLFSENYDAPSRQNYQINLPAFDHPRTYTKIYSRKSVE